MKKSLLLFAFFCLIFSHADAQLIRWGTESHSGNSNAEQATGMCTDSVGNTYTTGYFNDTAYFGNIMLHSRGGNDIFVAKTDSAGNYIWAKSFGGTGADNGNAIAVDITGKLFVTGTFSGKMFFTSVDSLVSVGGTDIFIAKLDNNGNLLMKIREGGATNDRGNAIAVNNANGNFAMVGDQSNNLYFNAIKYNSAGTQLFSKLFSATSAGGTGVSFDNNDLLYTCGFYSGSLNTTPAIGMLNQGGTDGFVLIFSASGSTITQYKGYGGTSTDEVYAIKSNAAGTAFYVCGSFRKANWVIGYDTFSNQVILPGSATANYGFIEKAQLSSYTTVWAHQAYYPSSFSFNSLDADKYGNVAVAGDISMYKYASDGTYDWQGYASGSLSVFHNTAIKFDKYGNIFASGYFAGTNLGFGDSTLTASNGTSTMLYKIISARIASPTLGTNFCVANGPGGGDSILVTIAPTSPYNAGNVFTVQMDNSTNGAFTTPITIGTVSGATGGVAHCYIGSGSALYNIYLRVLSSNPASTVGDQSWLYTLDKPLAGATSSSAFRCPTPFAPAITLTGFDNNPNTNGNDNILWSPGGYTYSPVSVYPTVTTAYILTITDYMNGCVGRDTVTVNMYPAVNVNAGADQIICRGTHDTLHATGTNISTYSWAPAATLTGATTANPISTPTAASYSYTCTVTSPEGCTTSDYLVVSSPITTANAGPVSYNTCVGGGVPLTGTGTSSGGRAYHWTPVSGLNNPNIYNPVATPQVTTMYHLIATDTVNGCSGKDSINIIVGPVMVDANNISVTCANSGTLTAVSTGNYVLPLSYLWTPAAGLSSTTTASTTATTINTTTYHVTMTTGNGCSGSDTARVTVNPASFGVSFSATQQLLSSPPFIAQFSNSTPSLSNYTFTWYWGDGNYTQSNNATVFHTYAYNGNYDVTLVAVSNATGCSNTDFQGGYIFCTGGSGCSATATVSTPQGVTACLGDSLLLTCNTSSSYTYQWNLNGSPISGATSSTYYANVGGQYSVAISDGSCNVISQSHLLSFTAPPATPTITQVGNFSNCGGGTVFLNAPSGYTSYLWSTGAQTQNISVSNSGIYSVSVTTGGSACRASGSYTVNASVISPPSICSVGADTAVNHCMVIWERPVTTQIDSFIIYREGVVANQFNRIGAVDYSAFSTFTDVNSNPAQQSYRYEIGVRDSCGILSALSPYHKTIHLTINQGIGNTWNLIWNGYEGFSFGTYNIYRGTTSANMTLLTSLASTNLSYTDLSPPIGWVYYEIEAVNPSGCNPSSHSSYSSSLSNIVDNGGVVVTGTNPFEQYNFFTLFPNPASNDLTISFNGYSTNGVKTIELLNSLGQIVLAKEINSGSSISVEHLDISGVSNGVYFVKIMDGLTEGVQRLVISK